MSEITGKAKRYDGTPIDYVSLFDWQSGDCIARVVPDAQGNWSHEHFADLSCGITYVADGCEPITHGEYFFEHIGGDYWLNTVLLLKLDGSAADATGKCVLTPVGTGVSFASGRFGSALKLAPLSSTNPSGLLESTVSNPELSLDAGDFTIELFVNPSAKTTQNDQVLLSFFKTHNYAGWQLLLSGLKLNAYKYDNGGSTFLKSANALTTDAWHHVAWCRKSGVSTLYINGVATSSATDSSNYSSKDIELSIGYQEYGAARYPFTGLLDEIRITKGVARYKADFTPPDAPFKVG